MLELYKNIKRLRMERKMTQDELARRAGYTDRSSIAKIERGMVDLSQSKIKQFADIFGVTQSSLMGWEQEPEELADITAQVLLNPDTLSMVEQYLQLSDSDQYAVRLMIASLTDKNKKKTDAHVSREVETVSLLETE